MKSLAVHRIMADSSLENSSLENTKQMTAPMGPQSSRTAEKVVVKILVLGQANVGKTSLIQRFVNNKYTSDRRATIGVDFASKTMQVSGDLICVCQLWDTAGQERFQTGSLTTTFFRNADGVVLVYDVSCSESVEQLQQWREEIMQRISGEYDLPTVVIGNKSDLADIVGSFQKEIDRVKLAASEYCTQHSLGHVFASAKDGDGVQAAMMAISAKALDVRRLKLKRRGSHSNDNRGSIDLNQLYESERRSCMCGNS